MLTVSGYYVAEARQTDKRGNESADPGPGMSSFVQCSCLSAHFSEI
jgi:hypothetical protein